MILDILRLIDDLIGKLLVLIIRDIPPEQIVGCNTHVIFRILLDLFLALLLVACDELDLQTCSKAL